MRGDDVLVGGLVAAVGVVLLVVSIATAASSPFRYTSSADRPEALKQ